MKILLHICCSNCALYPVKLFRSEGHSLTGFWFNPNIHPLKEYECRLDSLKQLSSEWKIDAILREEHQPEAYFKMLGLNGWNGLNSLNGLNIPPSPERCKSCYKMRLEETAIEASKEGFDAFTTTLLISPYQSFEEIEKAGKALAERYNVEFMPRDFRPYFREAMALSKELGLYRQKYCGCIFSKEERNISKGQRHKGTKKQSKGL
jgi:predicted adenine nucleotide alpha hydrolase (AANH) superfamily ATPase